MSAESKILEFLKTSREFEIGRRLYLATPGYNRAFARRLSGMVENTNNRDSLFYELGKLAGLNNRQIQGLLSQKVVEKASQEKKVPRSSPEDILMAQVEALEYFELKDKAKELDLESPSKKKVDLQAAYLKYLKEKAAKGSEEKKSS